MSEGGLYPIVNFIAIVTHGDLYAWLLCMQTAPRVYVTVVVFSSSGQSVDGNIC